MIKIFKRLFKELTPPLILKLLRVGSYQIFYQGNFSSWSEAKQNSCGYDAALILEKVKESLLKVKRGEATYERDSVLFDNIQYSWPLLSALLWAALQSRNSLNLLDYGGSLGSSYFQNRKMLSCFKDIRWNVIEQPAFVDVGKKHFQNDILRFYTTIEECLQEQNINLILLSSVLPYLEKPHELLNEIALRKFPFVVIDRTPIINQRYDRLTIQKVPSSIYKASYPAWLFNRDALLDHFITEYEIVAEFDALTGDMFADGLLVKDRGFILKLKQSAIDS